jgi:hypothetical protein
MRLTAPPVAPRKRLLHHSSKAFFRTKGLAGFSGQPFFLAIRVVWHGGHLPDAQLGTDPFG